MKGANNIDVNNLLLSYSWNKISDSMFDPSLKIIAFSEKTHSTLTGSTTETYFYLKNIWQQIHYTSYFYIYICIKYTLNKFKDLIHYCGVGKRQYINKGTSCWLCVVWKHCERTVQRQGDTASPASVWGRRQQSPFEHYTYPVQTHSVNTSLTWLRSNCWNTFLIQE